MPRLAPALPEVNQYVDSLAHRCLSSLAAACMLISPSHASLPVFKVEGRWDTVADLCETRREGRSSQEFLIFATRWPSPLVLDQWNSSVREPDSASDELSNPWGETRGWIDGGLSSTVCDSVHSHVGTQGPGTHCSHKSPVIGVVAGAPPPRYQAWGETKPYGLKS